MRAVVRVVTLAAVCALATAAGVEAQEQAGLVAIDFRDASLETVVDTLGRELGLTLILDPGLRNHRVTVALTDRVSRAEALELLRAMLLYNGFGIAPAPGGAHKILALEGAQNTSPWVGQPAGDESERLVTTLVRIEAADATELSQTLTAAAGGRIQPFAPTNSLIISTTEAQLQHLLFIIRALDQASATELRILPLRYASAADVASQIQEAFRQDDAPEAPYRVVADDRTNSLIAEGTPGFLDEVGRFASSVDFPVRGKGLLQVVRVRNVDAEILAGELQALAGGDQGALATTRFSIIADAATNSLVISGEPDAFRALSDVIADLDHIPPRVSLDIMVVIVETSNSMHMQIDALLPLLLPDEEGDPVGFINIGDVTSLSDSDLPGGFLGRFTRPPVTIPIVQNGVPTTIVVPEGGAQVTAASGDVVARTLMHPQLLAASGEEQRIFAGENVPVPASSAQATTDAFTTSLNIERQDVGIDLRVTPVALSERLIELDLALNVTSVKPAATDLADVDPDAGPILSQFDLKAKIRLTDGLVAVVGSAPRAQLEEVEAGVPFLRAIPAIGRLFRSTRLDERDSRLVVSVQATTVASPEDLKAATIQRRLAFERHLARIHPLAGTTDAPYALLVETRDSREEAEQLAAELDGLPGSIQIVAWQRSDKPAFDVYLVGFHEIARAGGVGLKLRDRGFRPKLEVIVSLL